MLEKLWPARKVVIYNTVADFGYADPERQKPLPGFHFFADPGLLGNALIQSKEENWPEVRFCFSPVRSVHDAVELFESVCRMVRDFGDCVFAVPEIWRFQQAGYSPKDFEDLMLAWRHYGTAVMWDAQFTQKVDKTLLRVSTEIYCGRVDLEGDVDHLRRYARLKPEALAIVPNLPDWNFVHRRENGTWTIEKP